ncbi:hypothetical protein J6590_066768 [Homalodisca vitripennis]|nr:hypothetical protein J6590_066768 [Homalodisca vitripennis]
MADPNPAGGAMEVQVEERPGRILVNIENPGVAVPETRRNQYQPNKAQKIAVVTAIIHAHTRLCALFGLTEAEIYNLSLSMQVTSVLNTIHQILRQTANPAATGRINDKVVNYQIHVGDTARTVEKEVAHKAVREIFLVYGLNYNQPPFPPPWIGAAGPFLTFMSCFKHRMDEVRTGVGKFPIGKNTQGNQLCADLQQFGLNPTHHIHCEGITYPPVKRSAMAQSVGPLTQLIMLNQSRKNPNFSDKWKKACARSLSHIPNHTEIIQYIFSHDAATVSPYLATIGDLLTITGARAAVKAFFPFAFYFQFYGYTPTSVLPAPLTPLLIIVNNFDKLLIILGDVKSIHGFPFTSRKFFSANITLQAPQEPTNL